MYRFDRTAGGTHNELDHSPAGDQRRPHQHASPHQHTEFHPGYSGARLSARRRPVRTSARQHLDAAKKSLTDLVYEPDSGAFDIGCEQGMQEQLHLDRQRIYAAVRIFFATQAQAGQFVEAYQPGVVGTAKVTLYCMDQIKGTPPNACHNGAVRA